MPTGNGNTNKAPQEVTVASVRAERIAQGLPATITDPSVIAVIAAATRSTEHGKAAA